MAKLFIIKRPCLLIFLYSCFLLASCRDSLHGQGSGSQSLKIEVVAENLEVPWGMDFLPDGSLIFTERKGKISYLQPNGTKQLIQERPVADKAEGGLLGLAVDPDFKKTGFVFIYETVSAYNQIVRLKLEEFRVVAETVLVNNIPKMRFHNGGILRFGPDGYLYAGTGDAREPMLAQDSSSLAGKILRIDKDGQAAADNPFSSRVWSIGHRNVQGLDWNKSGELLATEHGPSGELNGWCCHDEINLIRKGGNYGWPFVIGDDLREGTIPPLVHSGMDTWAPGGGIFIQGEKWGPWQNKYLVACLRGVRLILFSYNSARGEMEGSEDYFDKDYQRLRNLIQAPDSSIYFCSSNKDGRAIAPLKNDDKIYRLSRW